MRQALRTLSGLTLRGRCLLSAGAALTACSLVLGQQDLLRAGLFLLVLPLAAVAATARNRYRLSCTRALEPGRVAVGRPTDVRLRLENVSRLPSGVLLMEDELPYLLGGRPRFVLDRLEAHGVREVAYTVGSPVRGRYRVGPLAVRMSDPFGLCELARSFSGTVDLTVTPTITPLPAVRLGGDWRGGGETLSRAIASAGADDASTREYRHGDDLRKVHWRSTARTGELMVRREEQPFQSRATLLLDTRESAHRGEGPASSFEWAVAALASVGVSLARSGFGLTVLTDQAHEVVPAGLPATEGLLLDGLAAVTAGRPRDLRPAVGRLRRTGIDGVLVAVLGQVEAGQAEELARLRAGSGSCIAVLLEVATWSTGRDRTSNDAAAARLTAFGWTVLRVTEGSTLASVWSRVGADARVPA